MTEPEAILLNQRYRLLGLLGQGGMGSVFMARDLFSGGREVAIKFLAPGAASAEDRDRLRAEFWTLSRLRHPNLVEVLDLGKDLASDRWFLTLEYVAGGTLAGRQGAPEPFYPLVAALLRGLDHIHARGFVHGDIKPENILMPEGGGEPKITDFGLAVARGASGGARGTLSYVAPEVLRGDPYTPAADFYALGATLYHVLAGRGPFDSPRPEEVVEGHLRGDPPFPPSLRARIPKGCEAILRHLLAKEPGHRPASGREVIRAIQDLTGTADAPALAGEVEPTLRQGAFVGRAPILDEMSRRLDEVRDTGRGQVVLLAGPAGEGKTRLADEIRIAAQVRGFTSSRAACLPDQTGSASPAARLLRELRCLTAAGEHEPAPARGTALDEPGASGRDPLENDEEAAGVARSAAALSPLLLIVEDVHLAGDEALRSVAHLARGIASSPVLVVFTGREDDGGAMRRLADGIATALEPRSISLAPLDAAASAALAASVLGEDALPAPISRFLHEESGGNPYLLTEMVESLLATGGLARQDNGAWTLDVESVPGRGLRASVGDAVAARLDRLGPLENRVVEILAVSGEPLGTAELAAMLGEASAGLAAQMARLVERDIVTSPDRSGFAIAHVFLREAIQERLARTDPGRLATLHGRIADRIQAFPEASRHAEWAALARHLEQAGRVQAAWPCHLRAADDAVSSGALKAGAWHLEQALRLVHLSGEEGVRRLEILERLADLERRDLRPDAADATYLRIQQENRAKDLPYGVEARLLRKRAGALILAGRFPQAEEILSRSAILAEAASDRAGLAAALNALGNARARQGDHEGAELHYRRALVLRRELEDAGEICATLNNLGMVLSFQGKAGEGAEALREGLSLARTLADELPASDVAHNLGRVASSAGRLDEAREWLEEAEQGFARLGAVRRRAQALSSLAEVGLRRGRFHDAARAAAEAADIQIRLGLPAEGASALDILGEAHRETGRFDAAIEAHERALALADRAGNPTQRGFALCALALDHVAAGDADRAAEPLREAGDVAEGATGRLAARLARARALAALASGDPAAALAVLPAGEPEIPPASEAWEGYDTALLRARAWIAQGRFSEAFEALERLASSDWIAAAPARLWEVHRLRSQCLSGLGKIEESAAARAQAIEETTRLTAGMPREDRLAFDALPAVVRLRLESGGAPGARIAPTRYLEAMYAALDSVTGAADQTPMLERIMDVALGLLGAERGMVLLFPEDGGPPQAALARGVEDETVADAISYSLRVVEEGRQGKSLAAVDAAADPRLRGFASVSRFHIRSILCVPMRSRRRILGTIYLDARSRVIGFDDEDLRFLEALAQHVATVIDNGRMMRALQRENLMLHKEVLERFSFARIIGRSRAMQEVFKTIRSVLDTSLPVLVQGESGTGKELVARALHYNGPRRAFPFLAENCAALPDSLLESQLFGHVRGAFTGAGSEQRGLFQQADRGTLFLDEVGEMSPGLQARLTRVLETGEFRPVGGSHSLRTDVRLIVATHRDLDRMTAEGRFRRDLLYRLNVMIVELPPLRERRDDIPLLAAHFLQELAQEAGIESPGIEDGALEQLQARPWPGNVRQLRNELSRLLVFRRGDVITSEDVRALEPVAGVGAYEEAGDERLSLEEIERRHILRALKAAGGDRNRAAQLLRVGRATVFRKIRRYELDA